MSIYKNMIENVEQAKNFYTTIKGLIENTSGTESHVSKVLNISTGILWKRLSETYSVLGQNGGFEPLKFKNGKRNEKSPEESTMPTRGEKGELGVVIPQHLVKYLSLEEGEALMIKVVNQESEKYKPSLELIGLKAFIRNQERKLATSNISKKNNKKQKNLEEATLNSN